MMNNSLQFTVFDAAAALRGRQLQSNLLRSQDFFGLAVNYNTFSHRRQLLFIGAYFASKLGSRGGAPPTSNPGFAHMIFCCYLQQFVGVVDFVLFFYNGFRCVCHFRCYLQYFVRHAGKVAAIYNHFTSHNHM